MKQRHKSLPPVPRVDDDQVHQILYPYGIGVDTHSKFIQVCVLLAAAGKHQHGEVRRHEREFPTDWPSLCAALKWARALLPPGTAPAQIRYCIESTGTYHLPVLRAWRGIPCVVNPLLAGSTRRKTDVLDARLLAHHSITGMWRPSFIPTQQGQELRILWAQRCEAVRAATRVSNRINNIILRFGHTFGANHPMRSMEGEALLTDLIDGHIPPNKAICPDGLPQSIRAVVSKLLQDMKAAVHEVRAATNAALNFIRARDWPITGGALNGTQLLHLLCTVPGVGETTSLTWLAEVLDPTRFEHSKQVAAFSGCDPSLKISAGKVTQHIRRYGNERLHRALLFAASGVLRLAGSPLGNWGRSIAGRHKSGGHRKACGAVARRIACALWHVHRKAQPFSYDGYCLLQNLQVPDAPLHTFLKPALLKTLHGQGIKTTQQLADAWNQGKLALIPGLGQLSLRAISHWMQLHGTRRRADIPVRSNTHNPQAAAPGKPPNPSGKTYALHPAEFCHKGAHQTKTQPHPHGPAAHTRKDRQ